MNCPFAEDLEVYFEDFSGNKTYGFVQFISDSYITVCIKQREHRSNDTCLLFYPDQWHKLTPQHLKENEF